MGILYRASGFGFRSCSTCPFARLFNRLGENLFGHVEV